jgi:hypothetical protein
LLAVKPAIISSTDTVVVSTKTLTSLLAVTTTVYVPAAG